jgi:D-proline reductase (dithiol) PrdB
VGRRTRRFLTRLHALFPALTRRWLERHPIAVSREVPMAALRVPLERARLGLVTTAGVHLEGQTPFDMHDPDGDPSLRWLPADAPTSSLTITHDHYDSRDARRDLAVVYPVARVCELIAAGRLGAQAERHAGLMGHVDGPHLATLEHETAPAIAEEFRRQHVDIVLLAPA